MSYWFRKTQEEMRPGTRAGLVGTANIRSGDARRSALDYIVDNGGTIVEAISSQPWSGDATVEVSIVNWVNGEYDRPKTLWLSRGAVKMEVDEITGSLSAETDLRSARRLAVNRNRKRCFQGQTPQHAGFVVAPEVARRLTNENGRSGRFIHPYLTGRELTGTGRPERFIIDVDADDLVSAEAAAPALVAHLRSAVLPDRQGAAERETEKNRRLLDSNPTARVNWHDRNFLERWWQLGYRRSDMIDELAGVERYIVLSRVAVVSRQSVYTFVSSEIRPSDALQVFAFEDEYSLGILHSTYHRQFFEELSSKMRVDLRYTAQVFDKFPWPQAPTEEDVRAVAEAAASIVELQHESLADGLTLGRLYNSLRDPGRNPLRNCQEAVEAAYGFSADDDVLAQLLALNESIADEEAKGHTQPRAPGDEGLAGTKLTTARLEPAITIGV